MLLLTRRLRLLIEPVRFCETTAAVNYESTAATARSATQTLSRQAATLTRLETSASSGSSAQFVKAATALLHG